MGVAFLPNTWSDPANVDTLRRLWGDGKSCREIAEVIGGVTKSSIVGKAHRLKLPRHSYMNAADEARVQRARSNVPKKPRAPRTYKPKPAEPMPEPIEPSLVTFAQRSRFQCWHIEAEEATADSIVCGRRAPLDGLCAVHRRLCWHPAPSRTRPSREPSMRAWRA